jgi:DNA-binding HxlR family transcriptional regulator
MDDALRLPSCSIGRAMEILGERWTLLILRECFYGVRRFSVMQRNLGIARNILSARLRLLVGSGVLERSCYQEDPARFEYRLTQMGLDLYPAVVAIMRWGDDHLCDGGAPVVLRHSCGRPADPVLVCGHCRDELDPRAVTPEPAVAGAGDAGAAVAAAPRAGR